MDADCLLLSPGGTGGVEVNLRWRRLLHGDQSHYFSVSGEVGVRLT